MVCAQLCIYAGEQLHIPIFICFKSRPKLRLDVRVQIGRALRLDWLLPAFSRVVSLAAEKGIEKKLVYPARMQCFLPFPGRKLDVDLVGPLPPRQRSKKVWDIYTYLDPKKNQKKIKVVAQFIDQVLNKADYEGMRPETFKAHFGGC